MPGVSPAAKQMGRTAARNILLRMQGQAAGYLSLRDYGSLATIGRKAAVAQARASIKFSGFSAWLFWLFVHIYFLIGFRNRLMVMTGWAWAYFTFERNARLGVGPDDEPDVLEGGRPLRRPGADHQDESSHPLLPLQSAFFNPSPRDCLDGDTMRAIEITQPGGPEVLQLCERPMPVARRARS